MLETLLKIRSCCCQGGAVWARIFNKKCCD